MKRIISLVLITAIINLSCSSLNTKDSYNLSTSSLISGDIDSALRSLPTGEGEGFITIMEKTYLNLLKGNPEIDELSDYAEKIDKQIRYKISRGAKSFFFIETPEGYYASEHEIIWMHFLLSWGYSLRKDYSKARVEVKKSSVLLSNRFSEEGRFDDAFMRVICGVLWNMCGEWDEAQIDFRRAKNLNPSMKWINRLLERDTPPKNLMLFLGGIGYQPYWNPKNNNFIRGYRDVDFQSMGNRSRLSLVMPGSATLNFFMTPDASGWYKRHKIRNSEISDTIDDVKYTEKFGVTSAKMTSQIILGVVGGLLIFTLLGGAGIGITLLGIYAESGEAVGLGIGVFAYGGYKGYDFAHDNYTDAVYKYRKTMNPADKYRFVRFLPEYSWLGWDDLDPEYPLTLKAENKPYTVKYPTVIRQKGSSTIIGYFPDSAARF